MKRLPVSKFQEQFWLLNMLAPQSAAYNIPTVISLSDLPNVSILEKALSILVDRHESLRTHFEMVDVSFCQVINPKGTIKIKVRVFEFLKSVELGTMPKEVLDEVNKPFSLDELPLFRVNLYQFENQILLSIVFHHIIVDLHSKLLFAKELSDLYNSLLKNQGVGINRETVQYSDYSEYHNNWLQSDNANKLVSSWVNELPSVNSLLSLPFDKKRSNYPNLLGRRTYFKLSDQLSEKVNKYANTKDTYSFVVLLSVYAVLLNRLSQQDNIIIGVPLSNRKKTDYKDTFGCFVNVVPISVDFSDNPSQDEIRLQIRQKMLLAHRKQEVPFVSILNANREQRNPTYNPYFQSGFTFEPPFNVSFDGLTSTSLPIERDGAQLDLFLTMWEEGKCFHGYLEYATDIFVETTIERIQEMFLLTAEEFVKEDNINSKTLLPESDKQLLISWNDTDNDTDTGICLHKKFEEKVLQMPNRIAIKSQSGNLTYREFNEKSNQLANFLIDKKSVKPEDLIVISLNRSIEMMIAIFAIIKAGGAYMPIDPYTPEERVNSIFLDSSAKIALTTKETSANIGSNIEKVFIDNVLTTPLSENSANPKVNVNSENLAYVLYTSGSTGNPKGVMIEHRSVINKLEWMQNQYSLGLNDNIMLKTSVTFDVSVWEIFWWFFNGASQCILPIGGEKDPATIISTIKENNVTAIIFVPSMFSPFVEYLKSNSEPEEIKTLKYIVQIGEVLSSQLVKEFNKIRTTVFNPKLINTYGPTEATVAVSYYNCPEEDPIENIFIGKPISNTKLLVLDKNRNIQPIGVTGELAISGKNLSRGYLNRPKTTNLQFNTINYFGKDLHVYRTGDLVKWTVLGELDFIGRVDNQVKIRGYRIELGDIEAKILDHPDINIAAVIVYSLNESNKQLVAYIVAKENKNLRSDNLKLFLSKRLPEYMIPKYIVFLDDMPLNTSGKINRKALPKPRIETTLDVIVPKSEFEKTLAGIWCSLLNIPSISIISNFFEAGGDSLLAIKMISRIKEELNIQLEPTLLMQYPSIQDLANYVTEIKATNNEKTKNTENERVIKRRDYKRFRRGNN